MRDNNEISITINRGEKYQPELFVSLTFISDPKNTKEGYLEDSENNI
jgi:hypothetical protein